ncbi:MAG: hypothetical protein GYA23_10970, partial [Methanomicrobiales archaeon]|nr:hypothetical protein [Methanomicrobiales archaeon]
MDGSDCIPHRDIRCLLLIVSLLLAAGAAAAPQDGVTPLVTPAQIPVGNGSLPDPADLPQGRITPEPVKIQSE